MEIREVLHERGNKYGSFTNNARVTQGMYAIAMTGERASELSSSSREMLHMVLHKLSRMVNGDPLYLDNLVDIIGYTQLMIDEINMSMKS